MTHSLSPREELGIRAHRFNLDYEKQLEANSSEMIEEEIRHPLLFLYFHLEKKIPLFLTQDLFSEDRQWFEKNFKISPSLIHNPSFQNWWGSCRDLGEERELNSKISFYQIRKKLDLVLPGETLVPHLSTFSLPSIGDWLIKKPWGNSGKGMRKLKNLPSLVKAWGEGPFLLQPKVKPIKNFSIYIENIQDASKIHREMYNTTIGKDFSFQSLSLGQCDLDLNWVLDSLIPLEREIQRCGAKDPLVIDAFTYAENGREKIFFSEINYRRTLGMVAMKLRNSFGLEKCRLRIGRSAEKSEIALTPPGLSHQVFIKPILPV